MIRVELLEALKSIKEMSGSFDRPDYFISTDTRTINTGDIFFALNGENFKGVKFVETACNKKASVVFYNQEDKELVEFFIDKHESINFVAVKDTLKTFQELAELHIERWKGLRKENIAIGITGSNGKTTHKELITDTLESLFPGKVLATKGNFNNHIGVPKTIFEIEDQHQFAIIEMGSNHFGEIKVLCDIAKPIAGLITNIGDAHLEFFIDRAGVFKEKRSLYDSIMKTTNKEGIFVLNLNDPFLAKLKKEKNVKTFGSSDEADIHMNATHHQVQINKETIIENPNLFGLHNYSNITACYVLLTNLVPDKEEEIVSALSNFKSQNNRFEWIERDGKQILMDAYNANPSSMMATLESFLAEMEKKEISSTKVCIIVGDMNELGDDAEQAHMELGKYLASYQGASIYFVGRYGQSFKKGNPKAHIFESSQSLKEVFQSNLLKNHDYFLLKASRSLQLESLIDIK